MKVQTRLSIYSSLIFGIIFTILSVLIYFIYHKNTEKAIYANLEKTAFITAWFYLEEDELNTEDFAVIRRQFREEVLNPFYQIYDADNQVRYGSEIPPLVPPAYLNKIREQLQLAFIHDDYLCFGIFYEDNQGDFVIITKEKATVLSEQMMPLFWILLFCLLAGIVAIIFLSRWIAYIAYKPFNRVIEQVKDISTNNLDVEIESSGTNDELDSLIHTFNDLLKRISETFVIQKNFVGYVSHEFKTPLASIMGNLEVFSLKDRTPEEYAILSHKLIAQITQLEEILNTLLVVSDLAKETQVNAISRIDELIWDILQKVGVNYPNAKIHVEIEIIPADEKLLSIQKDATQLFMALFNLIENGVKYSKGSEVDIRIYKEKERLCVSIQDNGIGIPPEQMPHINKPFYRADNAENIQGKGIGLSIALRILEKNNIEYRIRSEINKGTEIILIF